MASTPKPETVRKPYLTGSPVDKTTPKTALGFFGGLVLLAFLNLILTGTIASIGGHLIGSVLCAAQLALYYLIFAYQGISRGTLAVTAGEIQYRRQQEGRPVDPEDRKLCYHPMKGFISAFLGSLPLLILALIYAFTAKRQVYQVGALPSWVSEMNSRSDLMAPLTAYTASASVQFTDILRVIVRAELMPLVCIVGSANMDGILTLERLSPILVLLPALFFGGGYLFGTRSRTRTHTDIREGVQKRQRREAQQKRRKAAQQQARKLN